MEHYKELQATTIFKDATEFECQAMMFCFKTRFVYFEKNQKIINQGDPLNEVVLMLKGSAIVEHVDSLGEINIVTEIKKTEAYGVESAFAKMENYKDSLIAKERCFVMFLNKHRLINQCDNKCKRHEFVIKNLMSMVAVSNANLLEKLYHMSKRTIRDKLLSYFLSMSAKAGSSYFEIPYNKTELAHYLSVDRSALSAELSKMRTEKLIDYDKKQYHLLKNDVKKK